MPFPIPLPGSPDLLLFLLAALTFDALAGDWAVLDRLLGLPRQVVIAAGGWCDRRLNRLNRSAGTRFVRGLIITVLFALAAVAAGLALTGVLRSLPRGRFPYGGFIEVLIVAGALGVRRPWNLLRATGRALEWKGVTAGREAVRGLTGRHVYSLDEHGVVRVAIEGAAEALERQVVRRRCGTPCWGFRDFCCGSRRTASPVRSATVVRVTTGSARPPRGSTGC